MVPDSPVEEVGQALAKADLAAATLRSGMARDKAVLLAKLVSRIDLQEEGVDLTVDRAGLGEVLGLDIVAPMPAQPLVLTLPGYENVSNDSVFGLHACTHSLSMIALGRARGF